MSDQKENELLVDTPVEADYVRGIKNAGLLSKNFTFAGIRTLLNSIAQTFIGLVTFDAGIKTDTIAEKTAAAGVSIDGVLLKDGGIDFGVSVFNDYKEGVFTPVVEFGGVPADTQDVIEGNYVKIGILVTFDLRVRVTVNTKTGNATVSGLPFPRRPSASLAMCTPLFTEGGKAGNVPIAYIIQNSDSVTLGFKPQSTAGNTAATDADFSANVATIYVTGFYLTT